MTIVILLLLLAFFLNFRLSLGGPDKVEDEWEEFVLKQTEKYILDCDSPVFEVGFEKLFRALQVLVNPSFLPVNQHFNEVVVDVLRILEIVDYKN